MRHTINVVVILGWMLTLACMTATAQEPKKEAAPQAKKFLRIHRDADGNPVALQTALLRFQPADGKPAGLSVDLIGAVHVGEKSYYEQLNKIFESYDVLLYELVAPEGTQIPKGGSGERPRHVVGVLQVGMKDVLGLEFQLEKIDYTKKNFVRADMTPEEFSQSMKDRGESFLGMFFRMMGHSLARKAKNGNQISDAELLAALIAKDRKFRLKRIMAQQLEDLEGATMAIEGKNGSTIIGQRNKKAFEVLAREIKTGKRKIGVFYGAGHFPDMEKRLIKDFGMKQVEHRWLSAWSLERPKSDDAKKKKTAAAVPK